MCVCNVYILHTFQLNGYPSYVSHTQSRSLSFFIFRVVLSCSICLNDCSCRVLVCDFNKLFYVCIFQTNSTMYTYAQKHQNVSFSSVYTTSQPRRNTTMEYQLCRILFFSHSFFITFANWFGFSNLMTNGSC